MKIEQVFVKISVDPLTRYANITDILRAFVRDLNIGEGEIFVHNMHTTCSLVLNEDELGLLGEDLPRALERIAPTSTSNEVRLHENRGAYYAHDDPLKRTENLVAGETERINGHAHLRGTFIGQQNMKIAVANGKLVIGDWQNVLLVDFDDQGVPPAKERRFFLRAYSFSEKQSFWFVPFRWLGRS